MSTYTATIRWNRGGQIFTDNKYSRGHTWRFDGGIEVPASSSPSVVPVPLSVGAAVDPEEAFVAALSSCHMLFFLAFAAKRGFVVDAYTDDAQGLLERDATGGSSVTVVTLRPRVAFSGAKRPTREEFDAMHHESHEKCFIARSVKSEVRCEASME